MAMPFRFFVGGKLGSGQQGISWIHLDDAVRALTLCIDDETLPPKVNICSPNPASNAEISDAIAKVLRRPSWLTAPSFGLKLLFGEGAETILTGQFVVPGVLRKRAAGAPIFEHPTLPGALEASL
jgi:NAD dependent epimerase/dehydratase family enzyme